jgi:hypothetical protein
MGVQENEDESVNLLEVQHEVTEEEPIEQVFSQEAEDISTVEQSIESEDQERFEETARFEDIAAPQVEPKPQLKKASKVTRKSPTKSVNEGKPISKLQTELRKHSDARKKTDLAIINIRRELKDLLLAHHSTIRDLQKQMAQMGRKISTLEKFGKSTKVKTSGMKTSSSKKKSIKKKSRKNNQKKSRKR